ncbi:DUF3737 family protein [Anaeromicropila herbilytica]|uniref:Hydrogenase n=1 Tax=Anaeromicropila herbilytica TaxID=2785025 RepID=A0A7R7ID15_9FIRM|nr:DUF3737 family protein [Anaeromicropila herbilytica]BCN31102.1 hypothetical protein bsdtb5_23970 [Anaeromicropila herbilytica]
MHKYREQKFIGERALFQAHDLDIDYCTFTDGESPLKESSNLEITNSLFQWKYPLWYCNNVTMKDSVMFNMARAGIWYTNHINMSNVTIEAPKAFRRCKNIVLDQVEMTNASETLWNCSQITMKNVTAKGDYFAMGSSDIDIDGFTLVGNYSFDGVKNLTIRNAKLLSKDAFWNSENVTVYDSFISGEYLGWNSKNVTLINCTIESLQGMCYMENVILKDCKLLNTNLAFEYSTVEATVDSEIESVKNPYSGSITAKSIGEVIFDDTKISKENTSIITEEEKLAKIV